MKKSILTALITTTSIIVGGCGSQQPVQQATPSFGAVNPNHVEIRQTYPSYAYFELGTVIVRGVRSGGQSALREALRSKAGKIGATSVIIQDEQKSSVGGSTEWSGTGLAIRYK